MGLRLKNLGPPDRRRCLVRLSTLMARRDLVVHPVLLEKLHQPRPAELPLLAVARRRRGGGCRAGRGRGRSPRPSRPGARSRARSARSGKSRRASSSVWRSSSRSTATRWRAQLGVGAGVGPEVQRRLVERAGVVGPHAGRGPRRRARGPSGSVVGRGQHARPSGAGRGARSPPRPAPARVWKWCRWAPRERPARSATPARRRRSRSRPRPGEAIVASSSASRVAELRSAWLRRAGVVGGGHCGPS